MHVWSVVRVVLAAAVGGTLTFFIALPYLPMSMILSVESWLMMLGGGVLFGLIAIFIEKRIRK